MSLTTRLATANDYPTFAVLFPELAVADPLPTLEHFRERMLPRVVLALEGDSPVGYAFYLMYGATAHLGHVVVAPERRGERVGEALIQDVIARARAEGCARIYLHVKKENHAALRLYARCGLVEESSSWALRFSWSLLARLPRSEATQSFVPTMSDDPDLAARFHFDVERVALLRARPGTALVGLREGSKTVAFAAFDPAFPGAYPFRASRPSLAGALLGAIQPLADARFDFLNVAIEEDEALARALLDVGGELSWELSRMGTAI
jgi:GNAT superfamily N-acetyltransferase